MWRWQVIAPWYRIDFGKVWHLYDGAKRETACGIAAQPHQLGRAQIVSNTGKCAICIEFGENL